MLAPSQNAWLFSRRHFSACLFFWSPSVLRNEMYNSKVDYVVSDMPKNSFIPMVDGMGWTIETGGSKWDTLPHATDNCQVTQC